MNSKKLKDFIIAQDLFFKSIDPTVTDREHILFRTVKIGEEFGELCDVVISKIGTQRKDKIKKYDTDALEGEFADVIITTLMLAQAMNIDIDLALENKMQKIKKRYKDSFVQD